LIVLLFSFFNIQAQSNFDKSIFDNGQLEIISEIDSGSFQTTITMRKPNGEAIKTPALCPHEKENYDKLKVFSIEQKLELLNHENSVLKAYGFWLITETDISKEETINILRNIYETDKGEIAQICYDTIQIESLINFCMYIVNETSSYFDNSIKLNEPEVNKLKKEFNIY